VLGSPFSPPRRQGWRHLSPRKLALFLTVLAVLSGPAQAVDIHIPLPWDETPEPQPTPAKLEAPPPASANPRREKAKDAPEIQPYLIPRFGGQRAAQDKGGADTDFHHIPPIKLSKQIDADSVFRLVINCFPYQPQWHIDIKLVGGARYTENNTVSTFDTAGLAKYYAGVVAEMPLYSADEIYRLEEQERKRRGEVAKQVAELLKSLSDRDRALRMVGIGESVEAREQYRNSIGVGSAEKQIGYLKDVAGAVGDLNAANAAIVAARLALVGQCRNDVSDEVNRYLVEITQ